MISCARRYSKPGDDKRADMLYNNTIICRRGVPCSAKQHSLSPCSLPPRKFIPKQRAQNCFAPTSKTDGKTPSVFLSARPHPACAVYLGLVLYHNKDKRAFCALQYPSSLFELSAESGADLRRTGCEAATQCTGGTRSADETFRAAQRCAAIRAQVSFYCYEVEPGCGRRDV